GLLEPVGGAGIPPLGDHPITGHVVGIKDGKSRTLVRWAHVGEDQPLVLDGRVHPMKKTVLVGAVRRLSGRLEDPAIHAIEPAVIAAAESPALYRAELERSSSMGTVRLEQSHLPLTAAEEDEVLSQDADRPG